MVTVNRNIMSKKYVGISGLSLHDAGLTLLDDKGNIEFASQTERYTKAKHDRIVPAEMWERVCGTDIAADIDSNIIITMNDDWKVRENFRKGFLQGFGRDVGTNLSTTEGWNFMATVPSSLNNEHHYSHACAALMTRPQSFERKDCVTVVIDGVGEYRSAAIYNSKLELVWQMTFPKSIGYLYAFFTQAVPHMNLNANEDEYVVMGLSGYGEPTHWERVYGMFECINETDPDKRIDMFWVDMYKTKLQPLRAIVSMLLEECKNIEDAAASLQRATEEMILDIMHEARKYGTHLCYGGGVAQNIMANGRVKELFDATWIDLNSGDGGASLGAAGAQFMKDTGIDRLNWTSPFLGYNIEGNLDPEKVVDDLFKNRVCGIANGRAEFSHRAYGNRSLIADVRYDVQSTVNTIKQRQQFRPFAPAILEEHAEEYFSGPMNQWMQYCATAKHDYKSVTHVDGTGRVQLVPKDCKSVFRQVIECYYERTGVPMLLNTSLNIRGMPMVNDEQDAKDFTMKYGVNVWTS